MPWLAILFSSFICSLSLPTVGMATVYFVLLHTSGESLALVHKQLLILYASKTPRPFLDSSRASPPDSTSRASLTVHRLHDIRMIHYELVEFMEHVMKQFQTDILVLFLTSFGRIVMYTYSIVFNHREMFQDMNTFFFVCHSLYMTVNLVACLWMTCAGPTRIKDRV